MIPSACAASVAVGNDGINARREERSQVLAIVPYKESGIMNGENQQAVIPTSSHGRCQRDDDDDDDDDDEEVGQDGWEAARAWLWTLPKRRNVLSEEVEAWLNANRHTLSTEIVSTPRAHLFRYLVSQHKLIRRAQPGEKVELLEPPTARFKRSTKWRPVYAWLESLDTTNVVGSKAIDDWLAENPTLRSELQSKHTRHHLFHYIQKCHTGILKKRKKQGVNGIMVRFESRFQELERRNGAW